MAIDRRAALLGSTAAVLLAARSTEAAPRKPKGQAVIGFSNEPTVFNPLLKSLSVDQGVWWNLFDPLWGIDARGEFVPKLAREIPSVENGGLSADGLVWTIRLRPGVTWHDGTPFTAADVKFTIELLQNPKFQAASRTGHELVTDIEVVNATELRWRLVEAYSPYLSLLSWTFIVPRHALGTAIDPNTAPFNSAPIGTGAFKWGGRVAGDHLTLVANPDYFGPGPYLERLVFQYIPDVNALFIQFRTGAIDYIGLIGILPDQYEEAKSLADRQVFVVTTAAIENVTLNLGNPVLADKAVRHALYYGMDKQALIKELFYGLPRPAESYLPSENWAFNPDLPKHEYAPAKAKALLDRAGWTPGPDGVRMKDGKRLEFTCATTAGNATRENEELLLQQNWRDIGVSMAIRNMPGAVIWGKYWYQSEFDALVTYTNCTLASDPNVLHRFGSKAIPAKGGSGYNVYQYANPQVDALLEGAIRTTDRAARKAAYQQVQAVMRDELVMLPVCQLVLIEGMKAKLNGFENNTNVWCNTWNAATWFWSGERV